MRCRTMATLAYYIQIKLVIGSGDITVVESDVSGFCPLRDFAYMQCIDAVNMRILHTAVGNHNRCAAGAFFARLEE